MSFQHTLKIPRERIGALIGKGGRVKQQIEKRCGVEIEIDSETGDAIISGSKPVEQMEAFRAVEVITAISRGFRQSERTTSLTMKKWCSNRWISTTTRASLQMPLSG